MLPPLQTIVGTDSLPIFTGSRPSSRSSSTTLHSYPTSSHLPPVRSSHYTSDPSSALSPLSLLAGSHPSPSPSASGSFEVPQLGSRILHDNGRLLSPESFQNPSPGMDHSVHLRSPCGMIAQLYTEQSQARCVAQSIPSQSQKEGYTYQVRSADATTFAVSCMKTVAILGHRLYQWKSLSPMSKSLT